MRKKPVVLAVVVSTFAVAAAACGGGDTSTGELPVDAAVDGSSGGHDASITPPHDAGVDATMSPVDGNTPPVDGNVLPVDAGADAPPAVQTGTRAESGQFTVWGVTTDGYIIYTDFSGAAFALSLAPASAPLPITTGLNQYGVGVLGEVVFFWNAINAGNIGALSSWSKAKGYTATVAAASVFGFAVASADGTQIMFSTNAVAGATDIAGSNVDATMLVTLVKSALNDPAKCTPLFDFVGGKVPVVGSCLAAGVPADGGVVTGSIAKFGGSPSWTSTSLVTPAPAPMRFSGDGAGTEIFTTKPDGTGVVVTLATAASKTVDTNVYAGLTTSDGMSVVYGTRVGDLRRAPAAAPVPQVLVATGVGGFYNSGLSANGASLLVFTAVDAMGQFTNLFVAPAAAPGTLKQLTATTNASVGLNGPSSSYTTDDAYVLWADTYDATSFLATLHATNLAAVTTATLGTSVWSDFALTSTKVAFNANTSYVSASPLASTADILVVDTATGGPKTIATQADVSFAVTPAKDTIVYTFNGMPASARGLYVAPVP